MSDTPITKAGPRILARRLSNSELASRLRTIARHPRQFSADENNAVFEEAADRIDSLGAIPTEVEIAPGIKMWRYYVNGYGYFFPTKEQAYTFFDKVRTL